MSFMLKIIWNILLSGFVFFMPPPNVDSFILNLHWKTSSGIEVLILNYEHPLNISTTACIYLLHETTIE